MNPIKSNIMLQFIIWLNQKHPEIDILKNITKENYKELIKEFDKDNYPNFKTTSTAFDRWWMSIEGLKRGDHWLREPYEECYAILDKFKIPESREVKEYFQSIDPLLRYKNTKLHAIFLYTSEDKTLKDFIENHWKALSSLSSDLCDFYPLISQIQNEEDANDILERMKIEKYVKLTTLPGIFFWEDSLVNNYYISLKHFSTEDITYLLREIFDRLRSLEKQTQLLQIIKQIRPGL